MLPTERHVRIVELLNASGAVTVEELADNLQVSAMTIRRDLNRLKRDGHLQRCHGGAVLTNPLKVEESYDSKKAANHAEKLAIAKLAASLVQQGDSVFLDAGTTTQLIADEIKTVPDITVVTTDLTLATGLIGSGVNLVVCGGSVQHATGSTIGSIPLQLIQDMRFNLAFVGTACIDQEFNILTPTLEKSFLKKAVLQSGDRCFLVADSSKFYRSALVRVANLAEFTGVITNKGFTPSEQKKLKDKGITVFSTNGRSEQ